jgi:hypothetical protein
MMSRIYVGGDPPMVIKPLHPWEGGDPMKFRASCAFGFSAFRGGRGRTIASVAFPAVLLLAIWGGGTHAANSVTASIPAAPSGSVPAKTDSLSLAIEAAGDSSAWPGSPAIVVADRTDTRVRETGLGEVTRTRLIKILTEEGAANEAVQRFDYDPASNMIRIDSIRIIRGRDGRVVIVDPGDAKDLAAPAEMIYWGARMKLIALPRLAVGDAIEMRTFKKGFQIAYLDDAAPPADDERYIPPMRGHFYDVVTFAEHLPMKEKTYRLRVPRDKPVQYGVYNGTLRSSLVFADSMFVYEWSAHDVPAFKSEDRMPDDTDIMPKVVLATVESWPAKSRWFFQVNDPVFEADDAIRSKVRQLTGGLRNDDEKMATLLHWVAQEIRYSGLSMGKGEGYTLHPGTMTYTERCGVCKDIAGMLVTMLRAAGFTTYPVMTDAGARVEAIPADQFNHCVVAVERPDGSFTMLDPTWAPFDRATWSRLEGEQNYVIGSPRGEGRSAIRTFTPEESRMKIDDRARLSADGTIEGEMTIHGIGASDTRIRGGIADAAAADRETWFADLLGGLGPTVEVTGYSFTDPRDFSRDAEIRLSYRAPLYGMAGESLIGFVPPAIRAMSHNIRLCRLLAFTKGDGKREHDGLVWFSQEANVTDEISLPRGWTCEGPADSMHVVNMAGIVRARMFPEGARLRASVTAITVKRTIPAAEWEGAAEAADSLRALGGRLQWVRRGR